MAWPCIEILIFAFAVDLGFAVPVQALVKTPFHKWEPKHPVMLNSVSIISKTDHTDPFVNITLKNPVNPEV